MAPPFIQCEDWAFSGPQVLFGRRVMKRSAVVDVILFILGWLVFASLFFVMPF